MDRLNENFCNFFEIFDRFCFIKPEYSAGELQTSGTEQERLSVVERNAD